MTEERRYFGTDGVRGTVGEPPITADWVLKLGWAAGRVLAKSGRGKVIIGKDTRISGYMFESVLEAGLTAAGVDVKLLGPMPTPAIAYLTQTLHANAGIVISASHNPYHDNGIKFFGDDGSKLPDEVEAAIERQLERPMETKGSRELGRAERIEDATGRYIEFCKSTVPYAMSLRGLKVVVDCAHGATYHIAPNVFDELGAEVVPIGVKPNGLNINDGCGATSPALLQEQVLAHGADVGIALDGDGDRVVMVDADGEVLDGDELLFIITESRKAEGRLTGPVVGTVMSNMGFEMALRSRGVELVRANVGDRYVIELMKQRGGTLGGETSGHIICLDRSTTGDGIIAALQVLFASYRAGRPVGELKRGMSKWPQVLRNVRMAERCDPLGHELVRSAVSEVETTLGGDGRVLLRLSGTEPVVRVMVEGNDGALVNRLAEQLAGTVRGALSA